MSDLICRKSMVRCQTPGMCSPHGGCQPSVLVHTSVRYSNSIEPAPSLGGDKLKSPRCGRSFVQGHGDSAVCGQPNYGTDNWQCGACAKKELDLLRAEIEQLQAHKQGLIDLRETHGFDSWAAALVEIDKFKAANADLSRANVMRRDHLVNVKKAAGIGPEHDLVATVEALRKDAERYRAIRDDIPHVDLGRAIAEAQNADQYDSAVDAAMTKKGGA